MIRRYGVWALVAGLCGCLTTACLPIVVTTPGGERATKSQAKTSKEDEKSQAVSQLEDEKSTFRLPPDPRPLETKEETVAGATIEHELERTHYPVVPPSDGPPLPPLPLASVGLARFEKPAENKVASISDTPEDPPLVQAIRCMVNKRPAEGTLPLRCYSKAEQDMLLDLLDVSAWIGGGGLTRIESETTTNATSREVAQKLDQLDSCQTRLRSRASLVIDKMCLCKQIDGFGLYDPWPENHSFHPGEPVLVYVELRNFTSEKREQAAGPPTYVSSLTGSAEIYKIGVKESVWSHRFKREEEESRTLRHDYYNTCRLSIPDLQPGLYTLWIQYEDVPTKRKDRRSLDFRIITTPSVSGS